MAAVFRAQRLGFQVWGANNASSKCASAITCDEGDVVFLMFLAPTLPVLTLKCGYGLL